MAPPNFCRAPVWRTKKEADPVGQTAARRLKQCTRTHAPGPRPPAEVCEHIERYRMRALPLLALLASTHFMLGCGSDSDGQDGAEPPSPSTLDFTAFDRAVEAFVAEHGLEGA